MKFVVDTPTDDTDYTEGNPLNPWHPMLIKKTTEDAEMRRNRRLHQQLSYIIFASVCVVCGSRHKEKSVISVKSDDKKGRKQ